MGRMEQIPANARLGFTISVHNRAANPFSLYLSRAFPTRENGLSQSSSAGPGLLQMQSRDCFKPQGLVPRKNEWGKPQSVQNKTPPAVRNSCQTGRENKALNLHRNWPSLLSKSRRNTLSIGLNLRWIHKFPPSCNQG